MQAKREAKNMIDCNTGTHADTKDSTDSSIHAGMSLDGDAIWRDGESVGMNGLHLERVGQSKAITTIRCREETKRRSMEEIEERRRRNGLGKGGRWERSIQGLKSGRLEKVSEQRRVESFRSVRSGWCRHKVPAQASPQQKYIKVSQSPRRSSHTTFSAFFLHRIFSSVCAPQLSKSKAFTPPTTSQPIKNYNGVFDLLLFLELSR